MVCAELRFESIGGSAERCEHHACIVHQHVDRVSDLLDRRGGRSDAGERGEIQMYRRRRRIRHLRTDPRLRFGERVGIASREHDLRTGRRQRPGRLTPQPGGRPGDDAGLAMQVDAVDHLKGSGHAGSSRQRSNQQLNER